MPTLKEGCKREIKDGVRWCPAHGEYLLKCLAGTYPNGFKAGGGPA